MKMDPDARNVIELIKASGRPALNTMSPPEARQAYRDARKGVQPVLPDVAELRELSAPGPRGPIPMRLYRGIKAPAANSPVMIFIHGGGWVIGDLDTHDYPCRKLANEAHCTVIAIDYGLSPEQKFPHAVDDCTAAARWIVAQAKNLGIDPKNIVIGGDSAGGNLSAVISLISRDDPASMPPLLMQVLFYPGADMTMRHKSFETAALDLPLTTPLVRWFRDQYLRNEKDQLDWRASPLRAEFHANLPTAFVVTARFDPLCDEGREYAQKLEAAGVRVWHLDLSDQVHGFITMGKLIRAADPCLEMAASAMRYAFTALAH